MAEIRKLAAVMFTDIVGYTSLMSIDEQKTLKLLQENRELQKYLAVKHNGEFLKEMGDGTLLCFQSALDALRCAEEIQESVKNHPDLVKKYMSSVVPVGDNYFAALNSAVFSDGSFCYIPKGVRCPVELSTYFRINSAGTGQFERTLIIANEGSYVSYLEGCTAPQRDENQLHAAIVEIVALKDAEVKYSTVQNWYPGDKYE